MAVTESTRVSEKELRELAAAVLEAHGVPPEDAMITAAHLVAANLRGVDTHGVIRLKGYIQRIESGGNNPRANIKVVRDTQMTAVMDGDNSLGQVGGYRAMELAIRKAEHAGIGVVAMRGSNHYGMAAYYAMMPLVHDMIGISMTNVLACMAPTGGTAARVGNDPMSIAFPAGEEPPVVLDMAASKSSWGKAIVCAQKGEPLPEGCFQDKRGAPTLDGNAFLDGGTLTPIADHKGYGLALAISIMCGLLADGAFDTALPHLYKKLGEPGGNSFFMMAMKLDNFVPADHFKGRMDETIREIRSTPKTPAVSRIYLPGEIEHETERERKKHGVPVNRALGDELVSLAGEAGIGESTYGFLM
ncbi:MAG: hypothetical protein A2Z18_01480 [Armatimonadetes bacterium RBG_16_58_9]|nr:MAG: hypothetical protein A2Z18_01480 [Armatimonadetes bacterium RBG_16_58_9]